MKYLQVYIAHTDVKGNIVTGTPYTIPIRQSSRDWDCLMREQVNEGRVDGLKFESYSFGGHNSVPFGNAQRNFPESKDIGEESLDYQIGDIIREMKARGEWESSPRRKEPSRRRRQTFS